LNNSLGYSATQITCADIDTDSALLQTATADTFNAATGAYDSHTTYVFFNDSAVGVTGVTISGTRSIPSGASVATGISGGSGWSCPTNNSTTWSCTGDLAADDGTVGDNTADGTDVDEVRIVFHVFGTAPLSGATVVIHSATVISCASPSTCSNSLSAANTDGTALLFSSTDTINPRDIDRSNINLCAAGCGEDLDDAGGFTSLTRYTVFNDGAQAVNGMTVSGTVGGSAVRTGIGVSISGGPASVWACTTSDVTWTWSCSGSLNGDNGTVADDTADGDDVDQVSLTVAVTGVGFAGDTVDYSTAPITCNNNSPNTCVSGSDTADNNDSGSTTFPSTTDTLT